MGPEEYLADVELAWCPGCGNFAIRRALALALSQLGLPPDKVVLVTGIGQAAKIVHYMRVNGFDGLHGRTIAAAAGIKMANPNLTVIAESGDGDIYGEGGNHLLHNIRRNLDLTVLVHDNRVYGLTKGQASPTAPLGYQTRAQPFGVLTRPLNPLALAISLGAGFVGQTFSGEVEQTAELIVQAVRYRGFALVNILHPCPSWNRVQTFAWYKERLWNLADSDHDPTDRLAALSLLISAEEKGDRIPVGVLVNTPPVPTWEERHPVLRQGPLVGRPLPTAAALKPLLDEFI
ncbi:2-oxoacid ferredoxin oxidoreductase [Candidatus Bipolaricaulota bacterium]|nr:2-oxoacid ferredoxin oxidoreductase [Candidatus Bipolaricaulota bacterium]